MTRSRRPALSSLPSWPVLPGAHAQPEPEGWPVVVASKSHHQRLTHWQALMTRDSDMTWMPELGTVESLWR
jgi:hypothetical protein